MKKILLITSLSLAILSGCKDGLDAELPGSLNPKTFPKTEADFAALTTGVYELFTSKWSYNDGGITGDLFFGVEFSNIFVNDYPSDQIAYFPEWGGFFDSFSKADFNFMRTLASRRNHLEKVRFITKITKIIEDINASSAVSAANKVKYEAEARSARGITMYYLLTMYGPVPYIDDPEKIGTAAEENMKRPERSTYVARVESDLRFAADNLPLTATDYGRFNKGAALTFLMRLYLHEKEWAKAEQVGKEITGLGYDLVDDYASLFKVATEKNKETIWAISCDPAANGNNNLGNMNAWSFYTYPADYPGNISAPGAKRLGGWAGAGIGAFMATWNFYDSFNPVDKRRDLLVPSYAAINSSGNPTGVVRDRNSGLRGPIINKYPDDDPTAFAGNDIPVCRYADVLLMLAEAVNELRGPTSEAQGFINKVRKRAGLSDLSGADISSKESFRTALLRERGWELFFEGQRRVDLVRMGKFSEALTAAGKAPQPGTGLFPVPQYMLDRGMEQTAGY
ncbi:RagB/SusD family nutrient uptake outer membrane protein [Desertivirga brevis]|uniref:RagB/SusD family nutrient uptake outer membrane protein n=1 Tax=Desertivirga brevis TaxID=2810310 RepID=UPI001A973FB9|nr:RagB/SusD family nutrient uptake outer membrane protein [Pedobacter sp. SYSU D00873]